MTIRKTLMAGTAALSLAACTATDGGIGARQGIGLATGAVVGAAAGNRIGDGDGQVVATLAGALLGGLAGGYVGRQLDNEALQMAADAEYQAYASGQPVNWRADTGNAYGRIAPGPSYGYAGTTCRNYTHTIFIDGTPQTAQGRACLQPDGTWRPENIG